MQIFLPEALHAETLRKIDFLLLKHNIVVGFCQIHESCVLLVWLKLLTNWLDPMYDLSNSQKPDLIYKIMVLSI